MIAAFADRIGTRLREGGAAELGREQDECVLQHAPLPQILEQRGDGLIDFAC